METLDIIGVAFGILAALSGSYLVAAGFITRAVSYLVLGLVFYALGLFAVIIAVGRIASS